MKLIVLDSTAVPGVQRGPGSPAYFSRFAIDHLRRAGHTVVVLPAFDEAACADADAVWTEWCNEDAYAAAESGVCKKLVVRMRGYDTWGPLNKLLWQNVDALLYESRFVQHLAEEQFPGVSQAVKSQVLTSGIDVEAVPFKERDRGSEPHDVLALVARAVADKGYQLAFEYARQRPIELHAACAMGEQNPRLMRYLHKMASPQGGGDITVHPGVNTIPWLERVGANFLLSASTWETLGYTVIEALAMGIKPLVHWTPGADLNWPIEFLWQSFGDLDDCRREPYKSHAYRRMAEQQFDAAKLSPQFADLLLAPSTRAPTIAPKPRMLNGVGVAARSTVEVSTLAGLEVPTEPTRLVFLSPEHGGPRLADIRSYLHARGRLRVSATDRRLYVDFDPGQVEPPRIALDTIVRSDAAGLRRMLFSALPHVDEIVLSVDGRSDPETAAVAHAYADSCQTFESTEIGMTPDAWEAGGIHFASARNFGRQRVLAPWTLVLDTDEYLDCNVDLRQLVEEAPLTTAARALIVQIQEQPGVVAFETPDFQRLARTDCRWYQEQHNQLRMPPAMDTPGTIDARIVSDTSLRSAAERERRTAQRDFSIEELKAQAAEGNLNALFHVAKHLAVKGDLAEAVKTAEDFRLRIEPNGPGASQRQWVALAMAFRFRSDERPQEANMWACRALLDGPALAAFCLLGDLAQEDGDLIRAQGWYEAACALTIESELSWPETVTIRWPRLQQIKQARAAR